MADGRSPAGTAVTAERGAPALRVLFVCHSREIGGSELYLEQIARRMAREARVRVVCRPDPVMDDWASRLAAAGADVVRLDVRGPGDLGRLRPIVRWASVVHLTLANRVGAYQVLVTLACRLERRPLVCTHQLARETEDLPLGWAGKRFRALALGMAYGSVRRHIAVSEEGRRMLPTRAGLDARRTVRIANGADLTRFVPVAEADRPAIRRRLMGEDAPEGLVCCTVARLSAQKGIEVLIDAAAILSGRHERPPARFLVVGDGELRAPLERQVAERGMMDVVRLIGARPSDEVPSWLGCADVFVLPSHYEGLSIAVIEAMATGLPVVITQVSGTAELVPTAEDGRVVPAGDANALADALDEVLADTDLRRRLGARAHERAQRYSWDACFAETSALLREVALPV